MTTTTKLQGLTSSAVMQMEIDTLKYTFQTSTKIPSMYATSALRGHHVLVERGRFGTLIKQWQERPDHVVCTYHFFLNEPLVLHVRSSVPFISYYFAVEGSPVLQKGKSWLRRSRIKQGTVAAILQFDTSRSARVRFKAGEYKSVHVTSPIKNGRIMDEERFFEVLNEYKRLLNT